MTPEENVNQTTRPAGYAERVDGQWQLHHCEEHQWAYTPITLLVPEGEYCRNCGGLRDPEATTPERGE